MIKINILLIPEGVGWTAQCLQYDIAVQGKTIAEVRSAFFNVMSSEISYLEKTGRSLSDLPKAPRWYWDIYRESEYQVSCVSLWDRLTSWVHYHIFAQHRAGQLPPIGSQLRVAG